MKSRSLVALILASILGVLPLSTTWAIVQVTQLRMSTTSDGTATTEFPTGTQEVFVNFEYNNANNEQIKIELIDNEIGVEVFVKSETYTGSGKKNLSINGQMIMEGYKSAASTRNPQLMDQINLAKNNTNPSMAQQAQLPGAIAIARDLRGIALALRRDPASANVAAQLDQAIDRLTQTIAKGTQLIDNQQTPADQLIGRIETELLPLAQSAVDSLNAALPGISSEPGRALPGGSYLTSIKVGSTASSAANVEWTVALAATPTPSATSTTAPSTSGQVTATPTPESGGPTDSATPMPTSGQPAASATPMPIQSPATLLPNLTAQPTARGTTPSPVTPLPRVTPTGGPSPATQALAGAATVTPTSTVATAMSPTPGLTASPAQKAGAPPPTAAVSAKDSSGLGTGVVVVAAALLLGIVALWVRKRV